MRPERRRNSQMGAALEAGTTPGGQLRQLQEDQRAQEGQRGSGASLRGATQCKVLNQLLIPLEARTAHQTQATRPSLNGAMTFQPWIRGNIHISVSTRRSASMEPCPFSHGYSELESGTDYTVGGFNGAMTFQPWIRRLSTTHGIAHCCFNGAMTFQPWIRRLSTTHGIAHCCFNGAMTFQPWIRRPSGTVFWK